MSLLLRSDYFSYLFFHIHTLSNNVSASPKRLFPPRYFHSYIFPFFPLSISKSLVLKECAVFSNNVEDIDV